jgi:hypothetical protein
MLRGGNARAKPDATTGEFGTTPQQGNPTMRHLTLPAQD